MPFDATDLPYISAGLPGIGGVLREDHADFEVTELPLYEPTGEGTHLYLLVRREGWTTRDLQRRLAELAGCRPDDLGCAGLKDKHARCTQYFSVPRGNESDDGPLIARLQGSEDFELIEANRHANKLKTGHLIGNRFRITVRDAINSHLRPEPIAVVAAERVGDDFSARFDAVERSYLYRLLNRRSPPTLEAGLRRAIEGGDESDLIVVCGSFRVLEPAHRTLKALQHEHP